MPGKLLYSLVVALAVTAGCTGDSTDSPENNSQLAESGSGLEIQLPVVVRESSAVDITQVSGFVNVNGRSFEMLRNDESFSVDVPNVSANSDVSINISFIEILPNGDELTLAVTNTQTFSIGQSDQIIEFSQNQYIFPDNDSDGFSNIEERNNDTDPFSPESTVIVGNRTIIVQFNIPLVIPDPAITQVIVLLSDSPIGFDTFGNFIEATSIVATDVTVDVDIRLQQQFQGQELPLASSEELTIGAGIDDVTITLTDDDFDFSVDSDGDNISNLVELQQGTDPFIAN